ncbi:polyketide cyclase/dehydrase/lipid transport protein [Rhizobium subbaraonis]|uniref:Polyketide cyclase/dehydrase/lipid transport protein n=1 Tax=Rhizobium subbaraonis TaxID=908946 RepID=A0A285U149_9HYPH|nr:SRPBCC family protein [Rhizobium subbaraonis]SOC35654.1 polyketide cyclase/dehydrase/lipid transport protein [Rhizobium subbaraonis]
MSYRYSANSRVRIQASAEALFDYLDDHRRLAGHMSEPSVMMLGGRMSYEFDRSEGRQIGGRIRMTGTFLGMRLYLEVTTVERRPPVRKVWETTNRPLLLVIGSYRMGFEIEARQEGSDLRVFIDYDLPATLIGRLIGSFLGPMYARWCVDRIASDAAIRFQTAGL